MSLNCRPPNICLWKWPLVSMCSSSRARLNVLRGFFHTRFVEEISTKYDQKSGFELKPYILLLILKFQIGKTTNWHQTVWVYFRNYQLTPGCLSWALLWSLRGLKTSPPQTFNIPKAIYSALLELRNHTPPPRTSPYRPLPLRTSPNCPPPPHEGVITTRDPGSRRPPHPL